VWAAVVGSGEEVGGTIARVATSQGHPKRAQVGVLAEEGRHYAIDLVQWDSSPGKAKSYGCYDLNLALEAFCSSC
jgi:hypothetical protein